MSLLQNHLEQISLSANAIADLPFPPQKMFANALLETHDITSLIRDTEAHERALFSVDRSASRFQRRATRRATMFQAEGEKETMMNRIYAARDHRNHSAVARVLGGDMMSAIKRSTAASSDRSARNGLDVEVLLRGAEMLCDVYPIAGAKEKITALRHRHNEVSESLSGLETRVAEQAAELGRMNNSGPYGADYYEHGMENMEQTQEEPVEVTDEDIQRELETIRELETKKRRLEDRVTGMERDLGGLLR